MLSENIYINTDFKTKPDSSSPTADSPPPAPQKKTTFNKSCHQFSKVLLTSLMIYFLFLTILFSVALITLFKKYSQLLDEKPIIRGLNHTKLECMKWHSVLEDKVWSCCPKGWKPFSSHCYFTPPGSASWNVSEETCSSMGAHLLVIHSKEQQDFVTRILDPCDAYFIGLWDPGHRQWRWVDQTPCNESVTFWHQGEPGNDNEDCVILNHQSGSWGWNDVPCSSKYKSVCQMKRMYF